MPEGNLFRTKGRTGVSAGDPPVQESSSLEVQAVDRPAVPTSGRVEAGQSGSSAVQESRSPEAPKPSTFTWKQSPAQAERLGLLALAMRRQLGRRLDKRDVLDALVRLAEGSDEVRAGVLRILREAA